MGGGLLFIGIVGDIVALKCGGKYGDVVVHITAENGDIAVFYAAGLIYEPLYFRADVIAFAVDIGG